MIQLLNDRPRVSSELKNNIAFGGNFDFAIVYIPFPNIRTSRPTKPLGY